MIKVAVLDDYQNAFSQIINVEKYKNKFEFKVFHEPFADEQEAIVIIEIATNNLRAWFDEVPEFDGQGDREIVAASQDYYCHNQQQNPHTANVMKSLGLPEDDVNKFCKDMLFPKLA